MLFVLKNKIAIESEYTLHFISQKILHCSCGKGITCTCILAFFNPITPLKVERACQAVGPFSGSPR